MTFAEFGIPTFEAGQHVAAKDLNDLSAIAARGFLGGNAYADGTGVYPLPSVVGGDLKWEWGKLNGALAAGGTAAMSVWRDDPLADTGDNITVSAPPLLATGSLTSGSWVWVMKHSNGLWYVMGAPC